MKPKKIIIISLASVSIIGLAFSFSRKGNLPYDFVIAQKGDIVQEVSVTGRIEPVESVDLAFEKSGKVASINVKVGDKVFAWQKLINLENQELSAQLLQAQADLKTQQVKLDELRLGTRSEEIKVQEVKVENAVISVESAKKTLIDKIKDAYTKSEDAVRSKADQFFTSPRSQSPQLNIQVSDGQLEGDIKKDRLLVEGVLTSWELSLGGLSISSDLNLYLGAAKQNLDAIKSFLEEMALAVNSLSATPVLSQTTINAYRSDVSTARANVNTAATNLLAAEENLISGQSDLSLAEKELDLEKAGATQSQIAVQEAQVEGAEANVKNYQAQLYKTILYSPIKGVITKQNAKVGEIISANASMVSVMSAGSFETKANVPEADIAKIKISDMADITLDAYGQDVVFEAKVFKIDPAETMIEGVPTYQVTFYFTKEDERLKSGMTANIDILTAKVTGAVVIPQRAVTSKDGTKTVKVLEGEEIKEIRVETGLRGVDGNIEILTGINEGDKVVTFIKEK